MIPLVFVDFAESSWDLLMSAFVVSLSRFPAFAFVQRLVVCFFSPPIPAAVARIELHLFPVFAGTRRHHGAVKRAQNGLGFHLKSSNDFVRK